MGLSTFGAGVMQRTRIPMSKAAASTLGLGFGIMLRRPEWPCTTQPLCTSSRCGVTCAQIQSQLKRTLETWITLWSLEADGWNKDGIHPETDSWSQRAKVWGGSWQMTPCSSWSTNLGTRASLSRRRGRGWAKSDRMQRWFHYNHTRHLSRYS